MAENSKIEWTHHTFNPWRGCTKVSAGCKHCYAETLSGRNPGTLGVWGPNGTRVVAAEAQWKLPLRWHRQAVVAEQRARVFCASLADVLEGPETMPAEAWHAVCAARVRLADLIRRTFALDWLLLTKRSQNIQWLVERMFGVDRRHWPRNFRVGVSVEDQAAADARLDELADFDWPNFVSVEPLLGPVTLRLRRCEHCRRLSRDGLACEHCGRTGMPTRGIDWVIVGGESGPGARPMHPDWARAVRDQCEDADVPFLFKQWGDWLPGGQLNANGNQMGGLTWHDFGNDNQSLRVGKKAAGRTLDGVIHDGYPKSLKQPQLAP